MGEVRHVTPTRVSVTLTRTINLGNYESLKIEAGLYDDVRSLESPREALERVSEIVDRFLRERVDAVLEKKQ